MTLDEYVSAAGALPPDLIPQLGQYFAILSTLENKLDGGTTPTGTTAQSRCRARSGTPSASRPRAST